MDDYAKKIQNSKFSQEQTLSIVINGIKGYEGKRGKQPKDPLASHRECARLRLVRAYLCTDLYENLVGGRLLSYEHKFQIS